MTLPAVASAGKAASHVRFRPIIAAGFKVGAAGMRGANSPCGAGARRMGIREWGTLKSKNGAAAAAAAAAAAGDVGCA